MTTPTVVYDQDGRVVYYTEMPERTTPQHWNTLLDSDQSADFLATKLVNREPFTYVRFGDADIDWIHGGSAPTCDGEVPYLGLGIELWDAWWTLTANPNFYLGDFESFTTPAKPWLRLRFSRLRRDRNLRFLHIEALLLHRQSPSLLNFYRTLKNDNRRKCLVAPERLSAARDMLELDSHIVVDETAANLKWNDTANVVKLLDHSGRGCDILLLCCGRASKLIAAEISKLEPPRTIIELGSALDPLYVGRTRSEQLSMDAARGFMKELL